MTSRWWSFEFYYSLPFWAALAAVVVVARLLAARPRARDLFLVLASSAMLLAIPQFGARDLLLVLAFSAVSYAFCRALAGLDPVRDRSRRLGLATLGVLAILGFLSFFKYQSLQDLLLGRSGRPVRVADHLSLLGISYLSFKAIHAVLEAYQGTLARLDALRFLNYMTFFPAFISGPINRYQHFAAPEAARPWQADLKAGGRRIVDGLFKKFVLVTLVFPYVLTTRPLTAMFPGEVVVGLYASALYFYFDFAGYSDLAIGSARLMGLPLPENFNWPFLQKNIRDLWSNWHMSLTGWLIDYVYWPTVRKLRNLSFFKPRPVLLSIVGMNVTFIACGLWHGEAFHFVVWGAYHGLGISVLNLYQRRKRRIRSPALQRYFASGYSRWLGALATFNFFAVGIALFLLDLDQVSTLLRSLLHLRPAP